MVEMAMAVLSRLGVWNRRRRAVAALVGWGRLDLDDLRFRAGARASISATGRRGSGAADEDRDVAVAGPAADVDDAVFDVQWAWLVAVDFDAGAEAAREEVARHCFVDFLWLRGQARDARGGWSCC
jgi:hypothetical protein